MNFFQYLNVSAGPFASPTMNVFVVAIAIIWTLVWKGLSLWRAARRGDRNWFVALLILNTMGILDILYIYVFSKKKKVETADKQA